MCHVARTRSIWRLPDRRGWWAQWIPMVKEASPTARILLVGTQKDRDPVDWATQGSEARRKVSPSPTWPRSPRAACGMLDAPASTAGFLSARCVADVRSTPCARDTAASSSQRPPRRIGSTASAWRPSTRRRSSPRTPSAATPEQAKVQGRAVSLACNEIEQINVRCHLGPEVVALGLPRVAAISVSPCPLKYPLLLPVGRISRQKSGQLQTFI